MCSVKSQDIKALIKETRKEMKAKGVKRTSCFNAGLSAEVYSLNARMFQLETQLEAAEKIEKSADCPHCGSPAPNHNAGCGAR